jgi:hypothetical protein
MVSPIIVYHPKLILQPLDEAGDPDGLPVDVSCDMGSVELTVDTPTTDVKTFCGTFTIPDDITIGATFEVVVNGETNGRWSALVGVPVQAQLYDRDDATAYRAFTTLITLNPSLYGPDTPGEARSFSFDVAVTSDVTWESEVSS